MWPLFAQIIIIVLRRKSQSVLAKTQNKSRLALNAYQNLSLFG